MPFFLFRFYNGHDLEGDPISPGALAAAIVVPTLAALALAAGVVMFCLRARRRRRQRSDKLAVLAANGLGSGVSGSGSGKASDLLKAIAQAQPMAGDPLSRLAAVDWELDPVDLEVSTGEDGAEVRKMRKRGGHVA